MGHVLDAILRLPPLLALILVFLLPALEASAFVGIILPGEVGVILGGVLANQHKLGLIAVLIAAIAGAIIGDSVGYEVGRVYGRPITYPALRPSAIRSTAISASGSPKHAAENCPGTESAKPSE